MRLAATSGKPVAQVARELGISDSAIHGWRRELAERGEEAFPGKGHQTALEEENRRLKRELERVQQERDILKKAISIFSREPRRSTSFSNNRSRSFPLWSCATCSTCRDPWLVCMAQASGLPAKAEKMLSSPKKLSRCLRLIKADMGVGVSTGSCAMKEAAVHANGSPG